MSFVKSPDEVARIQGRLSRPHFFEARIASVSFTTPAEVAAALVPPGFGIPERPRVTAVVGRWESDCVGSFSGGSLYVRATYGGLSGDYVLAMYMDVDSPVIFGRSLLGEPKKIGRTGLSFDEAGHHGWVERGGVRLIDISLKPGRELGGARSTARRFNIKARPATDGVGLEEDAIVTTTVFTSQLERRVECDGTVELGGTLHDPLDEVEVGEIISASWSVGSSVGSSGRLGTIPQADYLPYFHGRDGDDWAAPFPDLHTRTEAV